MALCATGQRPWGPEFLSVVERSRLMTGFGVCWRVCHNVEISGGVRGSFNQASEGRAQGALPLSCLCGG